MKFVSRLAGFVTVVLLPLSYVSAQVARNLAEDFRVSTSVRGMADTTVVTGHAVGSADKMRIDVTTSGTNSQISPLTASGKVSMIVTDGGKTIAYLDQTKSQYLRVKPAEMLQQAERSGMKMEFSGTQATVDGLGAGPTILGHPTARYRVVTGMTMNMTAMGQQQTVQFSSSTEYCYATDIKGVLNPFASLSGGDMMNMFGSSNKEFADKMKAMQAKLPNGTPLRVSSSATIVAQGQTRVTNTSAEVISVQWVNADPKLFEIPSTFTAMPLPGTGGTSGGAIPPR